MTVDKDFMLSDIAEEGGEHDSYSEEAPKACSRHTVWWFSTGLRGGGSRVFDGRS